jgi:hypothetical protein
MTKKKDGSPPGQPEVTEDQLKKSYAEAVGRLYTQDLVSKEKALELLDRIKNL